MDKQNYIISKVNWSEFDKLTFDGQIEYLYVKKILGEGITKDYLKRFVETLGALKNISSGIIYRTTEDCMNFLIGETVKGINETVGKTQSNKEKTAKNVGTIISSIQDKENPLLKIKDVGENIPEKTVIKQEINIQHNSEELLNPIDTTKSNDSSNSVLNLGDTNQIKIESSLKQIYDYVGILSEGFRKVGQNDKFGFVDEEGKEVIACKYDDADDFKNSHAMVYLEGKGYGFINILLEEIIQCKFEETLPFMDGIAPVTFGTKWWYVNDLGIERKEMLFNDVIIEKDGSYGFIFQSENYKYNNILKKFEKKI